MRIKILVVVTVMLLLFTSINVISVASNDKNTIKVYVKNEDISFSKAVIQSEGEYISVDFDEANTYLKEAGKPMLPVFTKTFTFPLGTKIKEIECVFTGFSEEKVQNKVIPAPVAVPMVSIKKPMKEELEKPVIDSSVYTSSKVFPETWYDYKITCGLKGVSLTFHFYPVRYQPTYDILHIADNVDIKIASEKPQFQKMASGEEYDMVIIAPEEFSERLQPLIDHKNTNTNIFTFLKTTEEIYEEYTGRDQPEQIKYFIKDVKETLNISYVLLVGGMKGIYKEWYVPVRRTNSNDEWESGYLSDLYYADLYRYNETSETYEFDDWDSNGNDIFAEWINSSNKDVIDCDPDVMIGRLACRNTDEVKTVVNKIINYEKSSLFDFWKKKMIVIGGDTFPRDGCIPPQCEGEIETENSANYMKQVDYKIKKLFTSDGSLKNSLSVIRAMRFGAGFIHFAGHGNPRIWSTHPPGDEDIWINGLNINQMPLIFNNNRLPIVLVGGCHNSQFNVTPLNFIEGIQQDGLNYFNVDPDNPGGFWRQEWVRECWSWKLLSVKHGGAIATIGNTGLGYCYTGFDTAIGLGGWIGPRFFHAIAVQNKNTVGEAHAQAISDYVHIIGVESNQLDRKTVEEWVLLGDPSLRIGGYPPS